MSKIKIIMLMSDGASSRIIFHKLKAICDIVLVVQEEPVPNSILLKNRIKKLGLFKVLGQILFMLFSKILKKVSTNRINEIKDEFELDTSPVVHNNLIKVKNINQKEVEKILKTMNHDLILVNGTRIIKSNILDSSTKPFINTHVGITPKYRGVHGGYWALANNDRENCGVTVHLVDEGIDTGSVLYQSLIEPSMKDNFTTYPYLQTQKAVQLLYNIIHDIENNCLKEKKSLTNISNIWSHPTILEYVYNYVTKGVK
jgi:folate-dependent phosphoribosylglycinamide formyltransferase PurN